MISADFSQAVKVAFPFRIVFNPDNSAWPMPLIVKALRSSAIEVDLIAHPEFALIVLALMASKAKNLHVITDIALT